MNNAMESVLSRCVVILMAGMITYSCAKAPETVNEIYFTENCKVYDENDIFHSDTLRAQVLASDRLGLRDLVVVDSLICCSTGYLPHMFEVYTLDGDSLSALGIKGNGPDDFSTNGLSGVVSADNDGECVWVTDINNARLKRLNLTKSIAEGKAKVDSAVAIPAFTLDAFLINGRLIESEPDLDLGSFNIKISDGDSLDNVIVREPLYPIDFGGALYSVYYSPMQVSPDGRFLAIAMSAINQVNIINLEDMSRAAVSLGNVALKDNVAVDSSPVMTYYDDIAMSDDYVFAKYYNRPAEAYDTDYDTSIRQIHVVGLDGDLKAILPLDRVVYYIAYSSIDNSLYCISADEEICRYRLPDFNK